MAKLGAKTKYQPEMCEDVVELMKSGASFIEVMAHLQITRTAFYDWINPEKSTYQPDFKEATECGLLLSQAWWEKQGRVNIGDKRNFDAVLWFMNMKNRFRHDWRDKHEVKVDTGDNLASDILAARKRTKEG